MSYSKGNFVFDGWKIERLIGEGSYGKVYEIQKTEYNITTTSALKVISIPKTESEIKNAYNDGMDEQSVTTYFKGIVDEIVKEILIMSKVKSHPNVVSYEDHKIIEHEGGIGWDILIRMEFLTPFVDYQFNHKLSMSEIARLGIELAGALDYCHGKGLIHRDVKPENIFVSENGTFKIGDFGVAKTMDQTSGSMSKKGTEVYMAPEVYLAKPYGSSVDIYSLGLVMYRLLNGNRLPFLPLAPNPITFENKENALIRRMKGEVMPKPINANDTLAEIVLKACTYESKDRYVTAGEFSRALKAASYTEFDNVQNNDVVESKYSDNAAVNAGLDVEGEKTIGLWNHIENANADVSNNEPVIIEKEEKIAEKNVENQADNHIEKVNDTSIPKKKSYLGFILAGAGIVIIAVVIAIVCISNSKKNKSEFANELVAESANEGGSESNIVTEPETESASTQSEYDQDFEIEKLESRIDTLVSSIEEFSEVSIEEQVLVDQDGVKITALSIEPNGRNGNPRLSVRIENNTDKDIHVTADSDTCTVNGYMINPILSELVSPGEATETDVSFDKYELKECGIKTIANIELGFKSCNVTVDSDSDTSLVLAILSTAEKFIKYDTASIDTSAASNFEQPIYNAGTVLCDRDGVRVIFRGFSYETNWNLTSSPTFSLLVENNSNDNACIYDSEIKINDYKMDVWGSCSDVVAPGKRAIRNLSFKISDFEDGGIVTTENAKISFEVRKDYYTTLFEVDSVEIDLKADAENVDEIIDNKSEASVEEIQEVSDKGQEESDSGNEIEKNKEDKKDNNVSNTNNSKEDNKSSVSSSDKSNYDKEADNKEVSNEEDDVYEFEASDSRDVIIDF